jgi:flavin-dependent dehydrogenase
MLINNQSIAIVGGGPGGLTLARLLQLKGADVKVFERDLNKNARVQGALSIFMMIPDWQPSVKQIYWKNLNRTTLLEPTESLS